MDTRENVMNDDIYNHPRKIDYWLRRLKASKTILPDNKEQVLHFMEDCSLKERLSLSRQVIIVQRIVPVAEWVNKPFEEMQEADFKQLALKIEALKKPDGSEQSPLTKNFYGTVIKKFFKWLYKGECPKAAKDWFKDRETKEGLKPEDILSDEEVKRLIDACENPRDKAILSVLAETGARATELATLQIKSVIFDNFGAQISIRRSKTTPRPVRMILGTEYLRHWLHCHPLKNNPEAPLWVEREGKHKGRQMNYAALRAVVFRVKARTGISKKANLHAWRHYKATKVSALGLNETMQSQMMGWRLGTKMTRVYNHLSGKQVDDAYLSAMGLKNESEKKETTLRCHHCGSQNAPQRETCLNCNLPLTLNAAVQLENTKAETEKRLAAMEELVSGLLVLKPLLQKLETPVGKKLLQQLRT